MDLILADADGVVVIPSDCAEQIIADAEELARIEQKIGAELRSGGRRTGRHGQQSALRPRAESDAKIEPGGMPSG